MSVYIYLRLFSIMFAFSIFCSVELGPVNAVIKCWITRGSFKAIFHGWMNSLPQLAALVFVLKSMLSGYL